MTRRGFTLTELVVAMAVLAILGTALARLLLNNSRFVARQEAQLDARQTARAAMNLMTAELRAVTDSGITIISATGIGFRMPVAFGMLCGVSSGTTIASLAPVDSVIYNSGGIDGVAWWDSDGDYRSLAGVTMSPSAATGVCDADSIRVIPDGNLVALSSAALGNPGDVFYAYRTVVYVFAASAMLPGRIALWRRESGGSSVELLAPFSTDAGITYLVGSDLREDPSPTLGSIRGVRLRLIAESEVTPPGQQEPARFALEPQVHFVNRSN